MGPSLGDSHVSNSQKPSLREQIKRFIFIYSLVHIHTSHYVGRSLLATGGIFK